MQNEIDSLKGIISDIERQKVNMFAVNEKKERDI